MKKMIGKFLLYSFRRGSKISKDDYFNQYKAYILMGYMYILLMKIDMDVNLSLCLFIGTVILGSILISRNKGKGLKYFLLQSIIMYLTTFNILMFNEVLKIMIHLNILLMSAAAFNISYRFKTNLLTTLFFRVSAAILSIFICDIYLSKLLQEMTFENNIQKSDLIALFASVAVPMIVLFILYTQVCENRLFEMNTCGVDLSDIPMFLKNTEGLIIEDNHFIDNQKSFSISSLHELYEKYVICKSQITYYISMSIFGIFAYAYKDVSLIILIIISTTLYFLISTYKIRDFTRNKEMFEDYFINLIAYVLYTNNNFNTLEILKDRLTSSSAEKHLTNKLLEKLNTILKELKKQKHNQNVKSKILFLESLKKQLVKQPVSSIILE